MHDAHATSTAATGCLYDDRVTDVPGHANVLVHIVAERAVRTGDAGHAGSLHRLNGRDLVAHQPDRARGWADEGEAARLHALGEVGVLRQEAVAGVNGHGIGDFGRTDDRRHVQVTVCRRRRTDTHGLVGKQHVFEIVVRVGVDGDGLDAHLLAGALYAQGDLAAVGYNDFTEHWCTA